MVTDVCWNPPQGADVLGQELVVLIKAHCPSVPAQDLSFLWDWGFWGGNAGARFQRDKISRNSPISAPSHSRGVTVLLAWLPLVTIDWNTGICVPLSSLPLLPPIPVPLSLCTLCMCLSFKLVPKVLGRYTSGLPKFTVLRFLKNISPKSTEECAV